MTASGLLAEVLSSPTLPWPRELEGSGPSGLLGDGSVLSPGCLILPHLPHCVVACCGSLSRGFHRPLKDLASESCKGDRLSVFQGEGRTWQRIKGNVSSMVIMFQMIELKP